MKDFYELFVKELKDIYNAEKQGLKALPEMAKAAHAPKLKETFHHHHKETKDHVKRLEEIADELNVSLSGAENEVMKSLIREAHKIIASNYDSLVKDAALINCAQHIEHYEIASYGLLKAFARRLHLDKVHKLLHDTSEEEGNVNKKLTEIAEGAFFHSGINEKARKRCA